MDRNKLVRYLDELLQSPGSHDYCPNGLQVEGRRQIRRLITGVSACHELFVEARKWQADAVLVHHGIFWKGDSQVIGGIQYKRVRELIEGQLNLIAYHLPLDRHPEVGNNSLAANAFGLTDLKPFAFHSGNPTGFQGHFPTAIAAEELVRRCQEVYNQKPLVFPYGPDPVSSLAIVSGAAQRDFHTAIDAGLDAYITGEVSEWVMNVAREAGVHYLAAGHYATERLGIRALGEHAAEQFDIKVRFIDIKNPV